MSQEVKDEEKRIETTDESVPSSDADQRAAAAAAAIDGVVERSDAETKRILSKVDYRLVPLLAYLYLVAFVDRSNIGNAKIAGLTKDLDMNKGLRYNTAVTLFFVPYTLLEVPSNIVLKMMRPSRWIAILMFFWGLTMTFMGLVKSYEGLLVARFFLGVTESGFFPAATFLLTLWYRRYEVQRRMAVFYIAASLSGAFSGLLAFAIQKLNGKAGLSGWQWIFLIEGLVPVVTALVIWKVLPDSPETATFLTQEERDFLVYRLATDTGTGSGRVTNQDKVGMRHIKAAFADWRIWGAIVVFWGNTVGVYGFTATVPTVIEELGYSAANAQLLTIPIYIFAAILTLTFAFLSDKHQTRSPFVIAGFSIACFGFIAQLAIPHPKLPGLTYGFLFLVAGGLYSPFIPLVSWIGNNLAPSSKRAVGMALLISVGNMGGIMGSNIYLAREAPKYRTGFGVSLAMCLLAIVAAFVLRWGYGKADREKGEVLARETEEQIKGRIGEEELLDLGDRSPFFRYTL